MIILIEKGSEETNLAKSAMERLKSNENSFCRNERKGGRALDSVTILINLNLLVFIFVLLDRSDRSQLADVLGYG